MKVISKKDLEPIVEKILQDTSACHEAPLQLLGAPSEVRSYVLELLRVLEPQLNECPMPKR